MPLRSLLFASCLLSAAACAADARDLDLPAPPLRWTPPARR